MAPKQRMRIANEKASKNILIRGNVPKSSVSIELLYNLQFICFAREKGAMILFCMQ